MSHNAFTNLLLFVGSLLLAFVSYEILLPKSQHLEFIRSQIPGEYQTPLLNIRTRSVYQQTTALHGAAAPPLVLFVHGLSAGKSTMTHLGTEFARLGMNSYLIDLPGHGESRGKFTWENCQGAVQEALTYLKIASDNRPTSDLRSTHAPVFLVGHSMGAALAVQAAGSESAITGVIAISPAATRVDRTTPANLLILLGEFDVPFVRRGATLLFQQATGIRTPPWEQFQSRSNADGSKKVVLLPWTEHSLGIFEPRALVEMVTWLERFYPGVHFDARGSLTGLLLKLSICSSLIYSLVPGFGLVHCAIGLLQARPSGSTESVSSLREQDPKPADSRETGWIRDFPSLWLYGVTGILSLAILLAFNPWDQLRLMGGGYLCGFLCLTGVLALCCRRPPPSMLSCSWVDFASVLVSVAFFIALAAPVFSSLFVHLTVSQARLWRFPVIALSIYPFHLYDEWASRCLLASYQLDRLILFHLSTRLFLALILILGFFVLQNRQFLIVLVLPAMLLLSSLCWLQAWGVYRKTRSVTASAAFSALLTAWFLSTFFVQL